MTNFELLKEECYDYQKYNRLIESQQIENITDDQSSLVWGMTPYESFLEVILNVKRPKRFVVFGCSIGYQCFFWNKIFPDIPCIGIDIFPYRVEWANKMIDKYLIKNVKIYQMNLFDFEIRNGDLIWQNNLLFNDESTSDYNFEILNKYDIEIISYKDILNFKQELEIMQFNKIKTIKLQKHYVDTSWTEDQPIFYYYNQEVNPFFDVEHVSPELRIPENCFRSYSSMLLSKKDIKSDLLKRLYNKKNLKDEFVKFGFNVPELYFYSNSKQDIFDKIIELDTYVAKPAHLSESKYIFKKEVKSGRYAYSSFPKKVNKMMNQCLDISDFDYFQNQKIDGGVWWKETERGFILEQFIDVVYELKVFVVFGEPIIADLRTGPKEFDRLEFIRKNNNFLNWDKEYDLIVNFARYLKVDFFRIDFLYDGYKLYASECAFMPGTILPDEIESLIAKSIRIPYFKYYYPNLC